ncbi:MAG: SRPBCC family protein [Acidimicrobiales bacterium]
MCRRVRLTGSVEIALPPEEAFVLFTPTGERSWVQDWDPVFPDDCSDEVEPGTVFTTLHGDRESIWTVVHIHVGRSIAYAVTRPDERSGLVSVTCEPTARGTMATVSYDLTTLDREADAELERFAANYPSFLAHWERCIAEAVEAKPH